MSVEPVVIHNQAYEYLPWETLGQDIFTISKQILKSNQKFDRVIALAKGGLTFARSLNDFLEIPEVSSAQISFYTGVGTTNKTPIITQNLPVSIRNENVLLFDDVVDKGDTLKLAIDYINYHGVKSLTTATLVYKPWSGIKPDFFARETKSWVIFPNESREHIQLLKKMWAEKGDSPQEIQENLVKLGLPKPEVELFLSIE